VDEVVIRPHADCSTELRGELIRENDLHMVFVGGLDQLWDRQESHC